MIMRKNILSINGNRPMNYLLHTVLSGKYNFIPVSDVFQGINELKKKEEIDLILIDVDYHNQESWDFIQHIKTSGLYQDMPVIVLITKEKKVISEQYAASRVYDFFYKPFSPLDIIRTVDEIMYTNPTKAKILTLNP